MRSEDLEIAVSGKSNSIEWFVNGEKTKLNKDSVRPEEEGFNKINATIGECEETISIFVEVMGRPWCSPSLLRKKPLFEFRYFLVAEGWLENLDLRRSYAQ